MVSRRNLLSGFLVVALASAAWLVIEYRQWQAVQRYNLALADGVAGEAAALPGEHGRFAAAWLAHQQGEFKAARAAYSELEHAADPVLRVAAMYNLGNTYLQQAARFDPVSDADRILPLVEMAKASYRSALALDSEHWNARHNLEKALLLVPDPDPKVPMENLGQTELTKTVISADTEENLP